jgi:mannose-6-phosphate isomerase-like protein (cupin superfamily)
MRSGIYKGARVGVRRVVTEDVEGRSRIVMDGPAPESSLWQELWVSDGEHPVGYEPTEENASLEPPEGGTRWRLFSVPPDAVIQKMIEEHQAQLAATHAADPDAPPPPEITARDLFHKTNTLDYVYVLQGDISLELEDGSVDLSPGDCVVQRGTNHAWHNYGDQPVKLLVVMKGLS